MTLGEFVEMLAFSGLPSDTELVVTAVCCMNHEHLSVSFEAFSVEKNFMQELSLSLMNAGAHDRRATV